MGYKEFIESFTNKDKPNKKIQSKIHSLICIAYIKIDLNCVPFYELFTFLEKFNHLFNKFDETNNPLLLIYLCGKSMIGTPMQLN